MWGWIWAAVTYAGLALVVSTFWMPTPYVIPCVFLGVLVGFIGFFGNLYATRPSPPS